MKRQPSAPRSILPPPGLEEWSLLKARLATLDASHGTAARPVLAHLDTPDAPFGMDASRSPALMLESNATHGFRSRFGNGATLQNGLCVEAAQPQSTVPPPPMFSPVFSTNLMQSFVRADVETSGFDNDAWRPASLDGVLAALGLEADVEHDDDCCLPSFAAGVPPPPPMQFPSFLFASTGPDVAVPPPPSSTPFSAGSDGLATVGSAGHHFGTCKPCAFFHTKGCEGGFDCKFCHLCPLGEKKRRRKQQPPSWHSGSPQCVGQPRF